MIFNKKCGCLNWQGVGLVILFIIFVMLAIRGFLDFVIWGCR